MLRCLVVLLVLAAGCAAPGPPPVPDERETATVRTDRDPITSRFPLLGTGPVRWIGGTVGDDRVPGPSLYFVDAVVTLDPADVERLTGTYAVTTAGEPEVPGPLRDAVPAGAGWAAADDLDTVAGPDGWRTRVWLAPDERLAYVSARGE